MSEKTTTAKHRWSDRVEAHHAQSESVKDDSFRSDDFWRPFASDFRQDPRRRDDAALNRLFPYIGPEQTVLDVGGGAGRFALPLALRCRHVTIVDPSDSMLEEARSTAQEASIENVTFLQSTWEETRVEPADIVLCAHVVYGVADVVPFIGKLDAYALDRVMALVFMRPPKSALSPFWGLVHGEERIELPALPELIGVLWEMGIYPDVEMMDPEEFPPFANREEALERLRRRMYVAPGTPQDERLVQAMDKLLVDTDDGPVVRNAEPGRQGIVSWKPSKR